jgi:hypothetical protein
MSVLKILRDPEAEKRSLMSTRVPRCNGHQDGWQCKHYWFVQCNIQPMINADHFKEGERLRRCLLVSPTQNLDYKDLATACTQYEPSLRAYDPAQEAYDPISDEDIAALQVLQEHHRERVGDRAPFLPAVALESYKQLPTDDPLIAEVRARAVEQGSDLEARRREGEEARRRNQAISEYQASVSAWWSNRPSAWETNDRWLALKPEPPPGAQPFDPEVAAWQATAKGWWEKKPAVKEGPIYDEWMAQKPVPPPALVARVQKEQSHG